MHGIEAQQMGVGLDRAEVVDADHLDVLAAGFGDGPKHIAADAAKPVDCDPDCHSRFSSDSWHRPRGGCYPPTEMLTADRPVQPGENGLYEA